MMANGHESVSSTSNLNNTSCQKDIDAVQLLNKNRNKRGNLNEKLKLSWTGDLTSFKLNDLLKKISPSVVFGNRLVMKESLTVMAIPR